MEIMGNSTVRARTLGGVPVLTPNIVVAQRDEEVCVGGKVYGGWYVSYNNCDTGVYGCDTTAIVIGQMEKFLVLNGNHCEPILEAMKTPNPLTSAIAYFRSHKEEWSKFSDRLPEEAREDACQGAEHDAPEHPEEMDL